MGLVLHSLLISNTLKQSMNKKERLWAFKSLLFTLGWRFSLRCHDLHYAKELSPLLYTHSAYKKSHAERGYVFGRSQLYVSGITSPETELRYPKCQSLRLSHQYKNSVIFPYKTLRRQTSKSSNSPISLKGPLSSIFTMNFRSFTFPSSSGQSKQKKENWYVWSRLSTLGLFTAWKEHQEDWHSKMVPCPEIQ